MCMCKNPEERTNLVFSGTKCGWSRVDDGQTGDEVAEMAAGKMCRTWNARLRPLDFI